MLTTVDPMYALGEIPSYEVDEPRMVSYKTHGRRHQGTVCWFDLPARSKYGLVWRLDANEVECEVIRRTKCNTKKPDQSQQYATIDLRATWQRQPKCTRRLDESCSSTA